MIELEQRIARLEERLAQTARVGVVVAVFAERGTVRVQLGDADALVTHELPVLFTKTHADKELAMPDMGEHVLCVFLPTGAETGFVVGAFYSQADAVSVASPDVWHWTFRDGAVIEYDRAAHVLRAEIPGDVRVAAAGNIEAAAEKDITAAAGEKAEVSAGESATIGAPVIYLAGNLSATGAEGGRGTETKDADTTHTGSYRLVGSMHVTDLTVDNPINGVCTGGQA